MYRPLEWSNTYRDDNIIGCACRAAYEAGADAMLQGLVLEGSIRTKGNDSFVTITPPSIDDIVPWVTPPMSVSEGKNSIVIQGCYFT